MIFRLQKLQKVSEKFPETSVFLKNNPIISLETSDVSANMIQLAVPNQPKLTVFTEIRVNTVLFRNLVRK